jgi:hypothetical protein
MGHFGRQLIPSPLLTNLRTPRIILRQNPNQRASHHGVEGALTAVPEPSTWAMMILGFCGIGFMHIPREKSDRASHLM